MDRVTASTQDCTPAIADVRTLRAAAFAPFILGLTLFIVAVPLSYATGNKSGAVAFLAGSVALFVTAHLVKRGSLIAAGVLATSLAGFVLTGLVAIAQETRVEDVLSGLLGLVIFGGISWPAMRAVPACWRLRRLPWRRQRAGMRSAIAELPL